MKKFLGLIAVFGTAIIFYACASTPAAPSFLTFGDYPSVGNTLVYFSAFTGRGVEYMSTCIITNPNDLENVAALNYNNDNADSILSTWQNQYNAVTIASNMSVLRKH
jgi:hypothetical protein